VLDSWAAPAWWRYVTYAVGFLTFATLAALGELNGLLMATHVPAAASYGIGSLSDFGFHRPDARAAYDVVLTWCGGRSAAATSVFTMAHWEILVDCVFALLYPTLAGIILLKARRRLGQAPVPPGRAALVPVYRRIAAVALFAVPVLALADILENIFEWQVVGVYDGCQATYMSTAWFWALWVTAVIKYLAALVVVVSLLVVTLGVVLLPDGAARRIGRAFLAARGPLIVVALFALVVLLDPTGQAGDTIRRWEDDWHQAAPAAAFALLLGWLSGLEAKRVLATDRAPHAPPSSGALVGLLVAGVAIGVVGYVAQQLWGAGKGLLIPGAFMVVLAALSFFTPGITRGGRLAPVGLAAKEIPSIVAALAPIALGLVVFRAAFAELAYSNHPQFWWLVAVGVFLQLVGWGSYELVRRIGNDAALFIPFLLGIGILCALIGVGVLIAVVVDPWGTGDAFGTLGLLAAFFVGVAALAYLLIEASELFAAPQALAAFRIERVPWFGFFLVWLVLAAVLDSSGTYYDVRLLDTQAPVPKETPVQAYRTWEQMNTNGKAVPLLFVSTSGGGIRAAYWTAIVLECVLEGKGADACAVGNAASNTRADHAFFAASGISGGSLGLVNYEAHLARPEADADWPARRLGGDYLAPTVGWALFVDLPFALLRRDGGTDRAEVLERGWEHSWVDTKGEESTLAEGLFQRWRQRPFPLLLLNGTKVQDGCRFETSVLDESIKLAQKKENNETLVEDCLSLRVFERSSDRYVRPEDRHRWALASSEDLVDYICAHQDVRLSTAALMSARFPYILSSGRVPKCDHSTAVNLVDGGYFDTSAASPVVELWERLRTLVETQNRRAGTCVVPVFLQIDNHYASEPSPGKRSRPWESSVPLQALGGSRNAREANARQAAALAFGSASFGNVSAATVAGEAIDRVAHIYPRAHPGSKAPLGWTLSDASMDDLRRQLQTAANEVEIEKVRQWFSPALTCTRGPAR
jgi:hypothetical protein